MNNMHLNMFFPWQFCNICCSLVRVHHGGEYLVLHLFVKVHVHQFIDKIIVFIKLDKVAEHPPPPSQLDDDSSL